jgi:predicted amidohydrolase YtcJ
MIYMYILYSVSSCVSNRYHNKPPVERQTCWKLNVLTIFTAKSIITMNRSMPRAEAVAVRDGQIIEVGSLDTMQPWLRQHEHRIDNQFADAIIVPGLIDPHLHPPMAAVLLPMHFITAMEWRLPWETVPASTTPEAFNDRLQELINKTSPQELLFTWGHHDLWHGEISRARINALSADHPIIVWNRSFHELCMNDGALEFLGIDEEDTRNRKQIDYDRGRFYEVGLGYAIQKLNPYILAPERLRGGLHKLKQVVHFGGQTTVADLSVGMFDFDTEVASQKEVFENDDTPFRVELVANSMTLRRGRSLDETEAFIADLPDLNSPHLRFGRRVKLFSDGAFFSQLAQLMDPGYIDGHHGEWLTPPEVLIDGIREYWNKGYTIHVHVTGDLGLELALDALEKVQFERPRFNHGFTLEHFGYSTPEQVHRAAKLGASVSANIYYLHELSAMYAEQSVGMERASSMARIGTCMREGITTTLHSDFTMAPAQPLMSMWVAVNRVNAGGNIMCPEECLTPQQGLEAITINAARVIGLDHEIGSIRAGKKADFAILKEDPLSIDPMHIKDIDILATVFEGRVFPIVKP